MRLSTRPLIVHRTDNPGIKSVIFFTGIHVQDNCLLQICDSEDTVLRNPLELFLRLAFEVPRESTNIVVEGNVDHYDRADALLPINDRHDFLWHFLYK